ncbi:MAG: chromosomal replication initiator protein DnaA [Hydrogenophilus thermoluteolus]|jgi:chromosomal replication initiator protein|nr:chromosomal replication initiator protein DnaA [Hydrogenophilus thermoluteolus]MBW7656888.1 chromosomal replication initiator protein DnaA [Hydrogenophilus thermoluteolus]HCO77296.1 chromosomal replication initiator protein DnaA [Rhodocyclaceae bacterium]HNQ47920.1 chromosomal replication initiator protein DnaA [Hydrogenophilus thermoluteolus]
MSETNPSPSDDLWHTCCARLQSKIPVQQYKTWIRPLAGVAVDGAGAELRVFAPNRFILQWVRERYWGIITDELAALGIERAELTLGEPPRRDNAAAASQTGATEPQTAPTAHAVASSRPHAEPEAPSVEPAPVSAGEDSAGEEEKTTSPAAPAAVPSADTAVANTAAVSPPPTARLRARRKPPAVNDADPTHAPTLEALYERTRLNPNATFETLVTGRANDLARAAAMQVAHHPGNSYNPLFIYGGVGLGKTHLIHAIGNAIFQNNPRAVIRYVHAEDYYADVVRAYQQKSFDAFKRFYRSLDVLLIDDIQFFQNKTRTQEEFFHAFNALTEARKQIVITCDTYPKDIQGLEDRLISRFDWGLTVQIEPPELEMRVAILKKKAELMAIDLADDVAFLIAKHLKSNVRELEGALNKVVAYANFLARPITLELAKEALKDLLNAFNRQLTVEQIQKTVADYYKIKVAEMHSKKRTRAVARPRQVAMYLAKELTPLSLPAIGEAFGGRDHTTVIHACRTITELRNQDPQLNHDVHVLLQVLRG